MKRRCEIEVVARVDNLVGECPLWSVDEQALYWIDARKPSIQKLHADGRVQAWPLPHRIGSFGFRKRGGLIAAMQNGFVELDLDPFEIRPIVDPEPDKPDNRMNDGKCDRAGRFWCGSRDPGDDNPGGALYRLDPDFTCTKMDDGFVIVNGMAFTPDDRALIIADSTGEIAYRYDFDIGAGSLSNRRPFLRTDWAPWVIDGATFDADGYYWCALIYDGAIGRFDPDGRLDRLVRMPVRHPTMCNFGGPGLDILYVTSGHAFLTPEEKAGSPDAGSLFAIHGLGVRGLPEPSFAG